jgi:hypothetical protein
MTPDDLDALRGKLDRLRIAPPPNPLRRPGGSPRASIFRASVVTASSGALLLTDYLIPTRNLAIYLAYSTHTALLTPPEAQTLDRMLEECVRYMGQLFLVSWLLGQPSLTPAPVGRFTLPPEDGDVSIPLVQALYRLKGPFAHPMQIPEESAALLQLCVGGLRRDLVDYLLESTQFRYAFVVAKGLLAGEEGGQNQERDRLAMILAHAYVSEGLRLSKQRRGAGERLFAKAEEILHRFPECMVPEAPPEDALQGQNEDLVRLNSLPDKLQPYARRMLHFERVSPGGSGGSRSGIMSMTPLSCPTGGAASGQAGAEPADQGGVAPRHQPGVRGGAAGEAGPGPGGS